MDQNADPADLVPSSGYRTALLAAARVARAALEGSRSDRLQRLFDYLLERTLAGEIPSEQQIALGAFSDDGLGGSGQDANVRVYVHRLRKVLDNAFTETDGRRLYIPVGEYSLRLMEDDTLDDSARVDRTGSVGAIATLLKSHLLHIGALVLAIAGLLIAGWWWTAGTTTPLATTLIWQPLNQVDRPLIIVVGDYYLYARRDTAMPPEAQPQLVWDEKVLTREDLTILQMLEPAQANMLADYNQQYLTGGTIEALSDLQVGLAQLPALRRRAIKLVAASQLTPEMLKSSDIIYVGQFSGMPPLLREPLAQASAFRIEPGFGGLVDKATATRYRSDGMVLTDERIARRDFAYLAGVPGPAGNRLLVIAGLGDPGLKEAVHLVGDLDAMKRVKVDAAKTANGVELLYRVRTIKNLNVGAAPIMEKALPSNSMWDNSANVPAYRPFDDKPVEQPDAGAAGAVRD